MRILKIGMVIVAILLCFSSQVQASQDGDYAQLGTKVTALEINSSIPLDKEWRINFSQQVDPSTIQGNILLWKIDPETSEIAKVDITPVIDSVNSKAVIVKHFTPFDTGASYELFVNTGIKSVSGTSLSKSESLSFSTMNVGIVPTPNIIMQPTNKTVAVGQIASLSVVASGSGTLSYQWYSNTRNSTSGGVAIDGGTSSTYVAPTTTSGTQYYYCVVENIVGTNSTTATSKVVSVSVTANLTLDQIAGNIISNIITPDMSDLKKELAIHDYLVKNTQYDYSNFIAGRVPAESYTAYGVLTKGIGVCLGYAQATKLLLNKAGIEAVVVIGTAYGVGGWNAHAWNIVKLDGEYYHLDVTFDDPYPDSGDLVDNYRYFNLTNEEISKDHTWDMNQFPKCTKEFILKGALVNKICFDGDYIDYLDCIDQLKDYYSISRIKWDGSENKILKVFDTHPLITTENNWIYISEQANVFSISKLKFDGSQYTVVKDFELNPNALLQKFYVKDEWIYMVVDDSIKKMNADGTVLQDLVVAQPGESIIYDWPDLDGNWIYFRLSDSNKIIRLVLMELKFYPQIFRAFKYFLNM